MGRLNEGRRDQLEPQRMASTRNRLLEVGCTVKPGKDGKSWEITFPDGRFVIFWPYSGWFSGKRDLSGRGFKKLLKAIKK